MSDIKPRRLKVYYASPPPLYRQLPVIRLGGKYLLQQGFKIGDEVDVIFEHGRIIITKKTCDEIPVPPTQMVFPFEE